MVSRRQFLTASPAVLTLRRSLAASFPSGIVSFLDPATEFRVFRLTDPKFTCQLPCYQGLFVSRHASFLLFSSDRSGSLQPYRLDTKHGESVQIAEANGLHPEGIVLAPDEKSFFYLDGAGVHYGQLSHARSREIYRIADGWEAGYGLGVSSDGLYATVVEKREGRYRIQLISTPKGKAQTLVESDEELSLPSPRPKRAGVLYRRKQTELWLAGFDGRDNHKLALGGGEAGPAFWSRDGRAVEYLDIPAQKKQLRAIREYTPDFNRDTLVANTSQYAHFGANGDGSVFVGASASKASPYVLLMLRTPRRELTICEHRASDAALVSPVFSPDSQRVFFQSDKEGKMAIYMMNVDRLVDETGE